MTEPHAPPEVSISGNPHALSEAEQHHHHDPQQHAQDAGHQHNGVVTDVSQANVPPHSAVGVDDSMTGSPMASTPSRSSSVCWEEHQVTRLLQLISQNPGIVYPGRTDATSNKKKREGWQKIVDVMRAEYPQAASWLTIETARNKFKKLKQTYGIKQAQYQKNLTSQVGEATTEDAALMPTWPHFQSISAILANQPQHDLPEMLATDKQGSMLAGKASEASDGSRTDVVWMPKMPDNDTEADAAEGRRLSQIKRKRKSTDGLSSDSVKRRNTDPNALVQILQYCKQIDERQAHLTELRKKQVELLELSVQSSTTLAQHSKQMMDKIQQLSEDIRVLSEQVTGQHQPHHDHDQQAQHHHSQQQS